MMRSLLILACASTLAAAEDPGGWTAAKWGMTPDQVRAAVPESKPVRYEFEKGTFSTLGVDELRIGDGPAWSVYFLFDDAGKLARVAMQPAVNIYATVQEFSRVESLLAEKYTRPFDRNSGDPNQNYPVLRRAGWTIGQTSITLVHTDYRPRVQLQTLWLTYRPKPSVPL
jgi:hypothetical protein